MSPVIEVSGLSKRYVIEHESRHDNLRDTLHHTARKLWRRVRWGTGFEREEFWALRDVSFSVQPGEIVGVIGRNGAGKSTLLKILSRITEPTSGRVALRGRVASLLEVGTGFHPDLTGRENVYLNGAILGMSRAEIRAKFDEIVAFAEIERFLDTPVKRYSSGMYVRLAFAVAAHLDPEILIVDEVLAVGDLKFQAKCLGRMGEVARAGRTVFLVSHRLSAVQELCHSGLLLAEGRLIHQGPINEVVHRYLAGLADAPRPRASALVHQVRCPEEVAAGQPLWFELGVSLPAGVREPHFRATIYAETGEALVGLGTHLAPAATPAPGGHWRVRLDLPCPPLVRGAYHVNLALCDGAAGNVVLERIEHAVSFRVTGVSPFAEGRWPEAGFLACPHHWRVEPAEPAPTP